MLLKGIATQTPEMPTPYQPDFDLWKATIERFAIDPETALVGHSGGAGFLVRWLSENSSVRARKVVLVAPWLDPNRERTGAFFDFTIAPDLATRNRDIVIFNSDNDEEPIQESVRRLRGALPGAKYREFHLSHFSHWDMPSPEFPELLDEVLK